MFDDFVTYFNRFTFSSVKLPFKNNNIQGEAHVYNEAELYISTLGGNIEEVLAKLNKDIEITKNEIKRCENMLNNQNFLAKAPADKVSLEREKLQKHRDNLKVLEEKLKNL